jgi:hypothetical protein
MHWAMNFDTMPSLADRKFSIIRYIYGLFKEIKNNNLWPDENLKLKKDLILNAISSG